MTEEFKYAVIIDGRQCSIAKSSSKSLDVGIVIVDNVYSLGVAKDIVSLLNGEHESQTHVLAEKAAIEHDVLLRFINRVDEISRHHSANARLEDLAVAVAEFGLPFNSMYSDDDTQPTDMPDLYLALTAKLEAQKKERYEVSDVESA